MRSITTSEEIVEALKQKQAELGIETQAELAELLGVSQTFMSLFYAGKREAGTKLLWAIIRLWPDMLSGNGGNGDGDRQGDERSGVAGDGPHRVVDNPRVGS